jgi:hypothetical protein
MVAINAGFFVVVLAAAVVMGGLQLERRKRTQFPCAIYGT